jgi:HTH-type transcriptional regulator / antitoxin HigA
MIDRPFNPDWYSPPGQTIATLLEERDIPPAIFAQDMELSLEYVDLLLRGELILCDTIAEKLEKVLGSTKQFWLAREKKYREERARLGYQPDKHILSKSMANLLNS